MTSIPEAKRRNTARALAAFGFAILALQIVVAVPRAIAADMRSLEIVTKTGVQVFSVEVAKTDEERERGLMFRTSLPDGQGMLFDF